MYNLGHSATYKYRYTCERIQIQFKYRIKYIVNPTKRGNTKRGENTRQNLFRKAAKSPTPKHVHTRTSTITTGEIFLEKEKDRERSGEKRRESYRERSERVIEREI